MPYELGERPSCQKCGGSLTHPDERCLCGGRSQSWPEPQQRQDPAMHCPMCEVPAGSRSLTWREAMTELRRRYAGPV
jgi:hypothetical protein